MMAEKVGCRPSLAMLTEAVELEGRAHPIVVVGEAHAGPEGGGGGLGWGERSS